MKKRDLSKVTSMTLAEIKAEMGRIVGFSMGGTMVNGFYIGTRIKGVSVCAGNELTMFLDKKDFTQQISIDIDERYAHTVRPVTSDHSREVWKARYAVYTRTEAKKGEYSVQQGIDVVIYLS